MTKDCLGLPDVRNYVKQEKPFSQLVVLTNHFPSPQEMVAQAPIPPYGCASSSLATILMTDILIGLSTRVKNCDQSKGHPNTNDTSLTSQPDHSLTLENPTFELSSRPSNEIVHRTMHKFKTQASKHYSIVEDLSQAPCSMFAWEVLQSFPTQ